MLFLIDNVLNVLAEGLDELLKAEQPNRPTPLAWLRQSATSNSPKTIPAGLGKLMFRWKEVAATPGSTAI